MNLVDHIVCWKVYSYHDQSNCEEVKKVEKGQPRSIKVICSYKHDSLF